MAEHYRKTIARVTQEFSTGIPVQNNVNPDSYYVNLAWRGLMYYDTELAVTAWHDIVGPNPNNPSQVSIDITNSINNLITNDHNQTCQ